MGFLGEERKGTDHRCLGEVEEHLGQALPVGLGGVKPSVELVVLCDSKSDDQWIPFAGENQNQRKFYFSQRSPEDVVTLKPVRSLQQS